MNFSLQERLLKFFSLLVLCLLILGVIAGNGEQLHARLLILGESIWQDYFLLRTDLSKPDCQLEIDFHAELDRMESEFNQEDELQALFDEENFDRESARLSILKSQALCQQKFNLFLENKSRMTVAVQFYRNIETGVASLTTFFIQQQRIILLLILFLSAINCSLKQQHIAFRPIKNLFEFKVSILLQFVGNSILLLSVVHYFANQYEAGTRVDKPELFIIQILGFLSLCLCNAWQILNPNVKPGNQESFWSACLTIPLYSYMAIITGIYFFFVENNFAGPAIFFTLIIDQAALFVNVGLYIWVGMLLKQTQLGVRVFNVFAPWRLSSEILAVVAIVIMAVPTAYTGASGIIIIAMGAVVYEQMMKAGARNQLALATTAMTGSAGVVLRPCLLVVLIAALNKEVVTDQLYDWGLKTFLTTIFVFAFVVIISRRDCLKVAKSGIALLPSLKAGINLMPYFLIVIALIVFYQQVLQTEINEFSVPYILPIIILAFLYYEIKTKPVGSTKQKLPVSYQYLLSNASAESTTHIGALLLLMGLSFVSGGVIERSEILLNIPHDFESIWSSLGFLVLVLVLIGMIMEPFGAVVLVSGALAQIAYQNGINPVHFWMITLVSFELGYLSPPVALNHLLCRQIMGSAALKQDLNADEAFWYRHERLLLPIVTLAITLIIVAVIPVIISY